MGRCVLPMSHKRDARLKRVCLALSGAEVKYYLLDCISNEPRREKTGIRGFRSGAIQTGLYRNGSRLEA